MDAFELPSLFQLFLGSVLFYTIYYIYWELTTGATRRAIIKEHGCKPIKSDPHYQYFPNNIFGYRSLIENLPAVKQHKFLELISSRHHRNGQATMHQKVLSTDMIQTIEPENLKTMLALNFKDWSLGRRRIDAFLPLLGHGIFTTDGAAWQHSREMLRPNFVRSQVGDLATFEIHVAQLIKAIPHDGSTVDLQDLFFQLTMDSATEFLFGESTDCLSQGGTSESSAMFAESWNRGQETIAEIARSGKLGEWLVKPQFKKDVNFVHDFVDHFVRKGLEHRKDLLDLDKAGAVKEEEGDRYIFLNELVKQTANPLQIRSELLNILLAGRDTTASLLSNMWFIMARRPDIWEKMRAEVATLGGERPTLQQIKDMKYLRWVINECLRLYPVVPGNSRTAVVDTVLPVGGGEDGKSPLFVPKGQIVQWSLFMMHRRKDLYGEDAEEFKPERWEKIRPGWEYLPFNGGPRICIGQQFALTEASYTTIRLMQEFKEIESRDSRPWSEWYTLTCAIEQGTIVGLTPA
ncbi:hypothetical protein N7G274_000740 [Stereocaulon virgatum]|uniref:Cytochrome P450 n=1 Tax=Stereocaulon virgatum TaxID=373712 RepID=A0ABR4APN5_9LECA